jgi:GrpB-like predicted nucleotidyltransferase (UPF0157 family)
MDKRKQIIEVLPYDTNWPKIFLKETKRLQKIFSANFITAQHIGSTAIPGLAAKPTIDILLAVKDIDLVDQCNQAMEKIGYEAWGEYGISGRRFFVKGENKRTHHVHAFQTGNAEIARHIYFRDYLILHPLEAKAYEKLKITLAGQFANDRRGYVENKKDFVETIQKKAMEFFLRKKLF